MTSNDSKINMSLQEIIDKDRKARRQSSRRFFNPKKSNNDNREIKQGRRPGRNSDRRIVLKRPAVQTTFNRNSTKTLLSSAATKNLVRKLVRNAINQRTNRGFMRRAVVPRRAFAARNSGVRPGFGRVRRSNITMAGRRLGGIGLRSRAIVKAARRRPVIDARPIRQAARARGRVGGLVSDELVTVPRRQIIRVAKDAPRMKNVMLVERVQSPFARRQRGSFPVRRSTRPIYAQPMARSVAAGAYRQHRVIQQSPRFVVLNNRNRNVQYNRTPFLDRIIDEPAGKRFVDIPGPSRQPYFGQSNVVRMRNALGIGANYRRNVSGLQPVSSFFQRIPSRRERRYASNPRFVF